MNYTRVLTAFIILYTDCLSHWWLARVRYLSTSYFLYISSPVPGYWVYVYINYLVQGHQLSLCIHELSCTHPMQRNLYGLSGCMYICTWLVFRKCCVYSWTLIVCRQGISCTLLSPVRACIQQLCFIQVYTPWSLHRRTPLVNMESLDTPEAGRLVTSSIFCCII